MTKTKITEEELDGFLEQILASDWHEIDERSCEPWRGGTLIHLSMGQVEREENEIFALDGDIRSIHTGEEENGSGYVIHCDLNDGEGLHVVGTGSHSLPDYSDDESDGYLTIDLYICDKADVAEARAIAKKELDVAVAGAISQHLEHAVALFQHAGDGLGEMLSGNESARKIMRAMAKAL